MKRIVLNLLLLMPVLAFSQTYKCEFSRFENDKRVETKTVYHTIDTGTVVDYLNIGCEVKLETLISGGQNYYIEVFKNSKSI